jgi:hypothetical protein
MSDRAVVRFAFSLLGSALLCLGFSTPCAAQDVPYVELSVGYNFMRSQPISLSSPDSVASGGENAPRGLYGDVAINLNHAVGVVGVLSDNQIPDKGIVGLMGGLRFSARGFARGPGRAIPFFQVLGGLLATRYPDQTFVDRALQFGGGANVTVTDHLGIRAELDYIRSFYREAPLAGENYIRFSIGVMYGFGAH